MQTAKPNGSAIDDTPAAGVEGVGGGGGQVLPGVHVTGSPWPSGFSGGFGNRGGGGGGGGIGGGRGGSAGTGEDKLGSVANAIVAFGDCASFGATTWVRNYTGGNDVVDFSAGSYSGGCVLGDLALSAIPHSAIAKKLGWIMEFRSYPHIGGVGMTIARDGRRVFGLDWHRFPLKGTFVNRPHYRIRPGIGRHRPWQ